MSEFSPLRDILGKKTEPPIEIESMRPAKRQPGRKIKDSHAFIAIIAVFLLGVIYTNLGGNITGRAIYEENFGSINISALFNESANITLAVNRSITSLRVTGAFIGNGTARIYLDNRLVIDKDLISEPQQNLITGMDISEDPSESYNDSSSNISESDIAVIPFENYCSETCIINLSGNATLIIELEDAVLNLTRIDYAYVTEIAEENTDIFNVTNGNESIANESVLAENITVVINESEQNNISNLTINETLNENITINETLNLTVNETLNITVNETLNLTNETLNITLNESTPAENISLNITEINITEMPVALTILEKFNLTLTKKGLKILGYNSGSSTFAVGLNENNFVEISENSLGNLSVDIKNSGEDRLSSNVVILENLSGSVLVNLAADNADTILRCLQFTDGVCRRWEKTDIPFAYLNNLVSFTVNESGVYSTSKIKQLKKEYIPSSSVYYNTDCSYCEETYNCRAEKMCILQSGGPVTSFTAQLDFDILEISDNLESAEVCAYLYYISGEPVINYLKDSPQSYCSDIRLWNFTSSLISYKLIGEKEGWVCIDATELIQENQRKGYSNVFINWIGQNFGSGKDFNCYLGISEIGNCGYYSPSGSNDCRPYLKLTYK
jgi:hypothetical protein